MIRLTDWLPFKLISDQLDILDHSILVKEVLDVLLVHPRLNIADPECLGTYLACLLICQSVISHCVSVGVD